MQKTKETRAIRYSLDDRIYNCICAVLTIFTVVVIIYPLYFVLIASFSDPNIVNSGKVMLFPEGISFKGYERVFQDARIWRSYLNTIIYTVGGTIFGTICTVMAGYALSRDDLPGTGIIMRPLIFAMYFSGGMMPGYLMIQSYHLLNTRLLMIILGSISVYNIIIVRTFMKNSIPSDLYDAATIDGCGNWKFFIKIVAPLSKPVIAVMVLYIAVMHWNSYFNAMLFLSDTALQPLQVYLRELLMFTTTMTQNTTLLNNPEALQVMQETATQLKYAAIVVSVLPILCVYPIVQKYFVKGVMIGAVKG